MPPVGGAPSRHTGTGGAADGVHAQCLRDSGAGDRSRVVPRAAARRSRVVPRSKQLGSQTRRCRAEQAAGQGSNKPTSHERDLDVSINSMAISFHGMLFGQSLWTPYGAAAEVLLSARCRRGGASNGQRECLLLLVAPPPNCSPLDAKPHMGWW